MSRISDLEQNVYNAYEDLRVFGVPENEWNRFERGTPLNWPAGLEAASDDELLFFKGGHLRHTMAQLIIRFEEPLGRTIVKFEPRLGEIKSVTRIVGRIDQDNAPVFGRRLARAVLPLPDLAYRTNEADYRLLVDELKAGRRHYEQLR